MVEEQRLKPPSPATAPEPAQSALAGLHVVDLSWVAAGPLTGVLLGYYGATVVRVESAVRIDVARGSPPLFQSTPGVDNSAWFGAMNLGKLGVAIDLNNPAAKELIDRLVDWADVIIEAFTPGTLARWALDYASVSKRKPGMVMCSLTLQGQTGPLAVTRGFGMQVMGMSGLASSIGWPDGPPTGATHAYTDYLTALYNTFAVLAALDYRDRTGQGQHIDTAQLEVCVGASGTAIPDFSANGRDETRQGNRLMAGDRPYIAPHGVYPVLGNDRWIAIAAADDQQWKALCDVLGHAEWLSDGRFSSLGDRCLHDAELDVLIAGATGSWEGRPLMERLQAAGVAAGVVVDQQGMFEDPQLRARGHFVPCVHSKWGEFEAEVFGARPRLTPPVVQRAAPRLGEHNEVVLREILGYSEDEYGQLVAAGVVEYSSID